MVFFSFISSDPYLDPVTEEQGEGRAQDRLHSDRRPARLHSKINTSISYCSYRTNTCVFSFCLWLRFLLPFKHTHTHSCHHQTGLHSVGTSLQICRSSKKSPDEDRLTVNSAPRQLYYRKGFRDRNRADLVFGFSNRENRPESGYICITHSCNMKTQPQTRREVEPSGLLSVTLKRYPGKCF